MKSPARIMGQAVLCVLAILAGCTAGTVRAAQPLLVAVAANFAPALEETGALFTRKTGIPVQTTVSSTGRLYAQIRNRAPFALFFSADTRRPQLLFEQGYCEEPEIYVRGRVVLWSRDRRQCARAGDWQRLVTSGKGGIGIPNPELAPYGAAARTALVNSGLWPQVRDRLVFAGNVGQGFQYAATGATAISFISASLAATATGADGCFLPVPEAHPVAQAVCVTRGQANIGAARSLVRFLRSEAATKILARYGYEH